MHTQLPPPESGTLAVSGCPTPAAGMEPLTPLAHASPPPATVLVDTKYSCLSGCRVSSHWHQELLPRAGSLLSLWPYLTSGAGPKSVHVGCLVAGTWSLQHTDGGPCEVAQRELQKD